MTEQFEESEESQVTLQKFEEVQNPSQVGEFELSLPEVLKKDVTDKLQHIHTAVRGLWGREALDAAVTELDPDYRLTTKQSDAIQLFTHLIWLQDLGLLPGYPRSTRTIKNESPPVSIQEYCRSHPDFEGAVKTDKIEESNCIERNRVYRSKIYSVTNEFWEETNLVQGINPWRWVTYSSGDFKPERHQTRETFGDYAPGYDDIEYATTAIFDDSCAHNVVVEETRNLLSTHTHVDGTSVPYIVDAPGGINEIDGYAPIETEAQPYWMFDLGITHGNNLVLLGNIIEDDPADEIFDQIKRSYKIVGAALIVMPSREDLHQFIETGVDNNLFTENFAPNNDVVGYLERQPSIGHVNKEIRSGSQDLRETIFLTRKQILDGLLEAQEILEVKN